MVIVIIIDKKRVGRICYGNCMLVKKLVIIVFYDIILLFVFLYLKFKC